MAEFDLSAARAKRANVEPKQLVLKDEEGGIESKYDLVPELPAMALDHGAQGRVGEALRSLFLDPADAEDFIAKHRPSVEDLLAIFRGCYGVGTPGESLASGS